MCWGLSIAKWIQVYEKAIRDDGTLYFPERLTHEFLLDARKRMGPYIFANQYQNEVVPDEARVFRDEWIKHYDFLPNKKTTFAFIDPAISQEKESDNTGIVVVHVDEDSNWYVQIAKGVKITPTMIVDLCFEIHDHFKPQIIGIEDVAFQKALLYMITEEMKRRGKVIPIAGIKPDSDKTKEIRILGLVPRFEYGFIYLNKGLDQLEDEYAMFPRGKRDILDALAYIDRIAHAPPKERDKDERPHPTDPRYEGWYIRNKLKQASNDAGNSNDDY